MTEKTLNPARKLFFGLFVFPLIIAVGMAVLLCSVVLLTSEKETPETLIGAIKSGSPSKRWQKAFELSNELNKMRSKSVRSDALQAEIVAILRDEAHYDPKTRSYMAMALHHFDGAESVSALRGALGDSSSEVQISAMWTLGALRAGEAALDVERFLADEKPESRKVAAYVLGAIGGPGSADRIRPLLSDPVSDVRWNAALALARLGDDSGFDVLKKMADRSEYAGLSMQETQVEAVMINAIKGLALIQRPESIRILQSLARDEKNLKVRQAAMDATKSQGNPSQ